MYASSFGRRNRIVGILVRLLVWCELDILAVEAKSESGVRRILMEWR